MMAPDLSPSEKARLWDLKDCGRGHILVIIANGPSINDAPLERLSKVQGIDICSINTPDPRLWPTPLWAWVDRSQYIRHQNLWKDYNAEQGHIWQPSTINEKRKNSIVYKPLEGKGFSRDPTQGVYLGKSSTYTVAQLALWIGYEKTYLFGVDLDPASEKLWFYNEPNPHMTDEKRRGRFALEAEHWQWMTMDLSKQERSRFVFCSSPPWPFVKSYARIGPEKAVDLILKSVKTEE